MAGFGLPMPGDFQQRGQANLAGAATAAGGMVDLHNINSANALRAQEMAQRHQAMMLDEAYRRDDMAQRLNMHNSGLRAQRPSTGDRVIGGLGGAFTGYMLGSALSDSSWAGAAGAVLGGLGGFL